MRKIIMVYLFIGAAGIVLFALSVGFFLGRKDYITSWHEMYLSRYFASDVNLTLLGNNLRLKVENTDKEIAWRILNEIETRIGAVNFNEDYDSFLHTNKSLHTLFESIRNELKALPLYKIKKDRGLVIFYHKILNEGIRPYLSKWHITVSHYHTKNKDEGLSVLEHEKKFPQRDEILKDIKDLNCRMKNISEKLLEIIEAK